MSRAGEEHQGRRPPPPGRPQAAAAGRPPLQGGAAGRRRRAAAVAGWPQAAAGHACFDSSKLSAERRGRGSAPRFGGELKQESSPRPQPALFPFSPLPTPNCPSRLKNIYFCAFTSRTSAIAQLHRTFKPWLLSHPTRVYASQFLAQ